MTVWGYIFDFAVLDEATSSLSEENESYFYNTLSQLQITVLTIGHRSTLEKVCVVCGHLYNIVNDCYTYLNWDTHQEMCTSILNSETPKAMQHNHNSQSYLKK